MARKTYPSDVTREQFEQIRPWLESARKHTKPRTLDLYEVFCAVVYVLKSGCQWRMLPEGFPKWRSVYTYFQIWSEEKDGRPSILGLVLKKLVGEVRQSNGRPETTSFLIIDAQSVKNTDTAKEKGYDAGKKVSGIKRHIAVDTNGLPHAVHVTTANVTDRAGAVAMAAKWQRHLARAERVLVDASYTGKQFAKDMHEAIGVTVEVVKRSELHSFKVMPKRWVVERSFSWLEKCRRLWKNGERQLNTSLQLVLLAFVSLLLKRL